MRFSIIIPTYNYGHFLAQALDSIFQQTYQDYEVFVIDDGSTDNTLSLLKTYTEKYDSLHTFSQQQQGPGKARNVGAKHAQGEWLLFLDADDYLTENSLLLFSNAIQQNPEVSAIIAGHYKKTTNKSTKYNPPFLLSSSKQENFAKFIAGKFHFYQGAFILQRDIFMALDGYPENIFHSEDRVLWGRLIANYSLINIQEPVAYIRTHPQRLRSNHEIKDKEALTYVNLLFDEKYLPHAFLQYKSLAQTKALLALAHNAYRAKQFAKAIHFYNQVAKISLREILHFRELKRYLVSWIRR